MNVGLASFVLLACAAGPHGEGLSTDHLDEYVQYVQTQRKACGPTSVWFCLRKLGLPADRAELCREAGLGPDGTSLQSLLHLCAARGLRPDAVNCAAKDIRVLPVPSIAVVDQSHCVVYLGTDEGGDQVRYYEPATDRVLTAARSRVERNWTGEAIVFGSPVLPGVVFYSLAVGVALSVLATGAGFRALVLRANRTAPVAVSL